MDIVVNIPQENDNKNQTNQLLVEQFKHFNIEIYGTYEEPLFKAKDIGNLLEIKNINSTLRDFKDNEKGMHSMHTPGGIQDRVMLTEKGLYKVLMRSRKKIAEQFQDWVFNIIKQIRLNTNNVLQNRIKELEFYKEKSYEPLEFLDLVYCNSTDIEGIYKVGKTTHTLKKRKSQTEVVLDIKNMYCVKTIDCDVLEKLVHLSLFYYRVSKREHFKCTLEHIKFVIDKCAKFVNTVACIRQSITPEEFVEKLGTEIISDKIIDKIVEKEKIVEKVVKKIVYKNKYINNYQNSELDFDLDELLSIDEPKILIQELN